MQKNIFRLLPLLLTLFLFSCAKDELLEETASLETADLRATIGRSTTPCVKSLNAMVTNGSLNIGCVSNLKGQTVNLPKGADIKFDGGTILNGTLNFNGGTIDGRLLNSDLKIKGDVTLMNSTYTFEPDEWGIKQGNVSKSQAWTNLVKIREAISQVKKLGGNTFKIGKFDAYFGIGNHKKTRSWYSAAAGIAIPDRFTLKMSDDTHLRVYANDSYRTALIGITDVDHAKVEGGNLHGDRDKHIYNGGSHEWGILIEIEGATYTTVQDVTMQDATGDGMTIQGLSYAYNADHQPSNHTLITNCTFNRNRRNNLSITDANNTVIQNNTFLNAGVDTKYSKGTNPRFAIDIEAGWKREDGIKTEYEKVNGVIIRNNVEKGSARGGFTVSKGDNVTIENNTMENSLSYRYTKGTKIRNNTLNDPKKGNSTATAIRGGIANYSPSANNEISGNKISGFKQGIILYGKENKVYNNEITDCFESIFIRDLRDTKVYGNKIRSSMKNSRGIFAFMGTLNKVEFNDNDVNVDGEPFYIRFINRKSSERNFVYKLEGNTFRSKNRWAKVEGSHGAIFENNDIFTSIWIEKSVNIKYLRNMVDGSKTNLHTMYFRGGSKNIDLGYNRFTAKKGTKNTYNKPEQNAREIKEYGNRFYYK